MPKYDINSIFDPISPYFNGALLFDTPPPSAQNTFTDGISPSALASGELQGQTTVQDGYLQSGNFVTGSTGWQIDANGNVEFNNGTFRGDLEANSINIPDSTNPLFAVDSSGNATAIGLTSLNMKAYTNFEAGGRFVLTGDVAPTFGNRGMRVAPGATASHYARALWNPVNSIFNNNPSFTATVFVDTIGATNGVGFVGLGQPTISGSGFTETGKNHCGFEFKKISGVLTVIAIQCDGGGTVTFSSTLATLSNSDIIELFLKKTSTAINYYTRVNGGALSSATTLSATLPSGLEDNVSFMVTNKSESEDFILQLQCAAYEH